MRPLDSFNLLRSRNTEALRSTMKGPLGDFFMSPLHGWAEVEAYVNGTELETVGIYFVEYSTKVRLEPRLRDGILLIHIPLTGANHLTLGKRTFEVNPENASILHAGQDCSMVLGEAAQHLLVRLEEERVSDVFARNTGVQPSSPVVFDTHLDFGTPANRYFWHLMMLLVEAVGSSTSSSSLAIEDFEQLLISQLLLGQPHSHDRRKDFSSVPLAVQPLARAVRLIEQQLHEPLTVEDIARAAGLGVRAVQEGFQKIYGKSPMEYLHAARLRAARRMLLRADTRSDTITDIALQCGIQHLGRFAAAYKERYGEPPSETLRLRQQRCLRDYHHLPQPH